MRQSWRVTWMVVGGIIGGWAGYWIGHLLGWSVNAEWPLHIGGGTGAILMSMGMSVLGVLLARLAVGPRLAEPSPRIPTAAAGRAHEPDPRARGLATGRCTIRRTVGDVGGQLVVAEPTTPERLTCRCGRSGGR